MLSVEVPAASRGWKARLELDFVERLGRTVLARRLHDGPLVVQRPFFPEADRSSHVYVLHPPGGVVGGDSLDLLVNVATRARTLLTTPAATKIYRSAANTSVLSQRFEVAAGASLEWLPQETIVYGGGRAKVVTRVELAAGARYAGWDIVCLGRPASSDAFERGHYEQRTEVYREGRPVFVDRVMATGEGAERVEPWGYGGRSVYATLVFSESSPSLVAALREAALPPLAEESFAVTRLTGVTICRFLGHSAERAKACLIRAWETARPLLLEKPACRPRIWAT
jgi:urease accessory protein